MLVRLVTERVPFSSGRCQPQPKSHRGRAQSDRSPIGGENLMEINVVGRHMDVPDRFRRHLTDKLDKVTQFAPAAMRVDVEISQEKNPRRAELSDRVELTVHDDGSVIRSEARADDRKSTRLNSSHVANSYAVFCLQKEKYRCSTTALL